MAAGGGHNTSGSDKLFGVNVVIVGHSHTHTELSVNQFQFF